MFTAAFNGHYGWLAAVAVANTIGSLFYYLRWLTPALVRVPVPPEYSIEWLTCAIAGRLGSP